MLEEYLDGPEVDVDVIMSFGQAVYGVHTFQHLLGGVSQHMKY